jgi:hypothetical protein
MSKKTFKFYCDESCHLENDKMPFMVLSYASVAYNQMKNHKERIKAIRKKHNVYTEIKWSKVSHSKYGFYSDIIEYFFETDLKFRALIINKEQISNGKYEQDYDDFYYKMYYQLLSHKLDMEHNYNVYLDIKDTLSAHKVNKLKEILNIKYSSIRNLQNIHSHESIFMQITDLLMGAISYHLRGLDTVKAKTRLVEKIKKSANHSLAGSTPLNDTKFNLFFIDLK